MIQRFWGFSGQGVGISAFRLCTVMCVIASLSLKSFKSTECLSLSFGAFLKKKKLFFFFVF